MRIKDIFSLKAGQKVSEKYLRQVLVTSICSILLCMSCLVGTTWAWFTVSIEDAENVIHIAKDPPEVLVTINGGSAALNAPNLLAGENTLVVTHNGDTDDIQQKSKLFVTFSVDESVKGYVVLENDNGYSANIQIKVDKDSFVSWTVSWFTPNGATPLEKNENDLILVVETDPTDETTDPTEESSEATEESSTSTETTEESSTSTETTEESSTSTETTVDSSSSTEATEESSTSTETTVDSSSSTEITDESSSATEPPIEYTDAE